MVWVRAVALLGMLVVGAAAAHAAYLRSVPPVSNKVPGPFGPNETPSVLVMSVLPGPVYAGLSKPK